MTKVRGLAAALVALLGLATSTSGQQAAERGWIGISYEVQVTGRAGRPTEVRAVVTDVVAGSPAAVAGIRPGDLVLSINGTPLGLDGFGEVSTTVNAGDPVRLVLRRGGADREILLRAAVRPRVALAMPRTLAGLVRVDSVADAIYRAMDSLRLTLSRKPEGAATLRLRGITDSLVTVLTDAGRGRVAVITSGAQAPRGQGLTGAFRLPVRGGDSTGLAWRYVTPEFEAPFGFYVFGGHEYDSLRSEIERVNRSIAEVRDAQDRRIQEQVRTFKRTGRGLSSSDPELVKIRRRLDEYTRKSAELRTVLERAVERNARRIASGRDHAGGKITEARDLEFRPLSPYVLGQNRAMGAQVVELRGKLSEYFGVDGGVLVVDVPPGTPAAEARILPGDVITRMGSRPVRSVRDLRLAISTAGDETPISLVRKGRALTVLLRR